MKGRAHALLDHDHRRVGADARGAGRAAERVRHRPHRTLGLHSLRRVCYSMGMTENRNEKTIDLAELTKCLGRPDHEQQAVAAFADSQGPWTEDEATLIEHVWAN